MEKKTVWVVDPNKNWREMLAEVLQDAKAHTAIGYDVTVKTFESQEQLQEALGTAKPEELPDAITTNVLSEDVKTVGLDLIRKLRGSVGTVIVSADLTTQKEFERQGITYPKFVSKTSFERADFYAAVKEAIEMAKAKTSGQPDPVVEGEGKAYGGGLPGQLHHGAFIV